MNPFYYWVGSELCFNKHNGTRYMEHTYSNGLETIIKHDSPKFTEGEQVTYPTVIKIEPKESEQ